MNVTCIRAGVKDLSSGDLIAKAMHIEEKMGNNPHFPNPTPSLATVTAARIALDAGVAEALGGAHRAVALRWVYHAELERLLVQLSKYVLAEAQGDVIRQVSSGFELRRPPLRITELAAPEPLLVKRPIYEGALLLDWPAVHGARVYQVFMNPLSPFHEEAWQMVDACSRRRTEVTGLASHSDYWFRVRAMGAAGVGPLSNVASGKAR